MITHTNTSTTLKEFLDSEDVYRTRSRVKSELLHVLNRNRETPYQAMAWLWEYIRLGGTQVKCVNLYKDKITITLKNLSVTLDHANKVWLHPCTRDTIDTTWAESIQQSLAVDDSEFKTDSVFTKELLDLMKLYIGQNTAVILPTHDVVCHVDATVTAVSDINWFKGFLVRVDTLVKQYPYGLVCQTGRVTANTQSLVTALDAPPAEYVFTDGLIGWVITVENHVIHVRDLARSQEISSVVLLRQSAVIDRALDACDIS
jgi:hypothetical protein